MHNMFNHEKEKISICILIRDSFTIYNLHHLNLLLLSLVLILNFKTPYYFEEVIK